MENLDFTVMHEGFDLALAMISNPIYTVKPVLSGH